MIFLVLEIRNASGSRVQPVGSYCFPGKEVTHSIKISLMALGLSKQEEEKEERENVLFCVRVGNELGGNIDEPIEVSHKKCLLWQS